MTILAAESVGQQLLTLAAEGLGFAVGASLCFSLALVGTIRASDARRRGHMTAAVPWTALALLSYATFAALVTLGLLVVVDK